MRDHAVSVFVIAKRADGVWETVLVHDPRKGTPCLWKLPGGKREGKEEPVKTAVRELEEETGISLSPESLALIHEEDKITHVKYAYIAYIDEFPPLKKIGDEGEDVSIFEVRELWEMADMLYAHYLVVEPTLRSLLKIA
ncbi:MAG: NUDIX hydrolase [Candidatus Spechtbacterales bacterium]